MVGEIDKMSAESDILTHFRTIAGVGLSAKAVWMHEAAAERARRAGMAVVMDRCMVKEHKRMMGKD